jgi:acyl-CoA reductase-like NAD-dependent aldehyde dehydrogenase
VAVLVGDVADKIIPSLARRTRELVIKNGMELDAEMGPIVTRQALDRIAALVAYRATAAALAAMVELARGARQVLAFFGAAPGLALARPEHQAVAPARGPWADGS